MKYKKILVVFLLLLLPFFVVGDKTILENRIGAGGSSLIQHIVYRFDGDPLTTNPVNKTTGPTDEMYEVYLP